MAQLTKRGSKWQARIQWRDYNKNYRHTKSKSGFNTKAAAREWAIEEEAKLNSGVQIDKTITFSDYWDYWVKTYKTQGLSKISVDRYNHFGKLIREKFQNIPLIEIDRFTYQEFINQFGTNHAPSTVQKLNGFIRACVKSAILDDYITKDFTQGVKLVSNKSNVRNVDYINYDEIIKLVNHIKSGLNPNFTSRFIILTAIYTGMRQSEIQALTWENIDFDQKTIRIDKSWDASTGGFKPTKNESSVRTIRVNDELLVILNQLKRRNKMVFTNQYGTIPTSRALNTALRNLMAEIGLVKKGFHFHSLRHSHVALLLSDGIDIYPISRRLGHANIATTLKVYAYLLDEYQHKVDSQIIASLDKI